MSFIAIITVTACNFLMQGADGKHVCRDFQLPRYELEYITPMQCMLQAQNEVVRVWLPTHKDWQISRIKCTVTNDKQHVEGDI